jgi:hypothetical protein
VLGQSAISGVLAIGLTIVLIAGGANVVTGGIDLSLAANMGLSAAVYATLTQLGYGDLAAIAGALLTGLAIGAVNAAAVVLAGIVPLLATLAVMNVVAGLELVLTQNTVIPASTDFLTILSTSDGFGIPVLAYVLLGFTAIVTAIIQYTRGRPQALCRRRVSGCGARCRSAAEAAACRRLPCQRPMRRHRWYFVGVLSQRQHHRFGRDAAAGRGHRPARRGVFPPPCANNTGHTALGTSSSASWSTGSSC